MTEIDILTEIRDYVLILRDGIQTAIYIGGVIVALLIVILFAKAWRNM